MISLHPNTTDIGNPRIYARDWKVLRDDTIQNVCSMVTKHAVSPIIWSDGVRRGANFLEADWLVLDIDEGPTIAEAIKICESYQSIIGTTKSHGIKGTHDRYRVFMPFCGLVDCKDLYRASVKRFIKMFDADPACADLARMFWPVKEIVFVNEVGFAADVELDDAVVERETRRRESSLEAAELLKNRHKNGSLPNWVRLALDFGAPGLVNNTCFKIALCLRTIGYGESEILDMILNSNLPNRTANVAFDDIRIEVASAVRSGVKTADDNLENMAVLEID